MAAILDGQFHSTCWKAFVIIKTHSEVGNGEAVIPLSDMVQAGYNPVTHFHYVKVRNGPDLRIDKAEYAELLDLLEKDDPEVPNEPVVEQLQP